MTGSQDSPCETSVVAAAKGTSGGRQAPRPPSTMKAQVRSPQRHEIQDSMRRQTSSGIRLEAATERKPPTSGQVAGVPSMICNVVAITATSRWHGAPAARAG